MSDMMSDHEMRIREIEQVLPAIQASVKAIEQNTASMTSAVQEIARANVEIAKVDMKHAETHAGLGRAFTELKRIDERVDELDKKSTMWDISAKMIFGMAGLILVGVIGAMIAMVVK